MLLIGGGDEVCVWDGLGCLESHTSSILLLGSNWGER